MSRCFRCKLPLIVFPLVQHLFPFQLFGVVSSFPSSIGTNRRKGVVGSKLLDKRPHPTTFTLYLVPGSHASRSGGFVFVYTIKRRARHIRSRHCFVFREPCNPRCDCLSNHFLLHADRNYPHNRFNRQTAKHVNRVSWLAPKNKQKNNLLMR